jgi:hypothetical protein
MSIALLLHPHEKDLGGGLKVHRCRASASYGGTLCRPAQSGSNNPRLIAQRMGQIAGETEWIALPQK